MRDSVPSVGYSPICNVLRQWKTSLIPTYRVYRLYDIWYNIYTYFRTRLDGDINNNCNLQDNIDIHVLVLCVFCDFFLCSIS